MDSIVRIGLVSLLVGALPPVWADFEVKAPDGRTLLIKDDGTWRVVSTAKTEGPQAELRLTGRNESPAGCTFAMTLTNTLPYEIGSIVPDFVVYRSSGVAYASQSVSFVSIKPGDKFSREMRIEGLRCADVARVQVTRGDRCEMGDLNRFSDANGQCLARVRVEPSELVKFEK